MKVFDMPHAIDLAEAKKNFLNEFLPDIIGKYSLKSALDTGCGFGYFSRYLKDLGLEVSAIDGRHENVSEARRRNPDIKFEEHNLEDTSVLNLGQFDIVLCLGLLYHLENPFCAIRNLSLLTKKVCLIETMILPSFSPLTSLIEEREGQDQGLNYIAQIASEPWLRTVLYKGGFQYVCKTNILPNHPDFRSSLFRNRLRTFMAAEKENLSHSILKIVPRPIGRNRYIWYRFGIRHILTYTSIRTAFKKVRNYLKKCCNKS